LFAAEQFLKHYVEPALTQLGKTQSTINVDDSIKIGCPGCFDAKGSPTKISVKRQVKGCDRTHLSGANNHACRQHWYGIAEDQTTKEQEEIDPKELDKWAALVILSSPGVPELHFQNRLLDQYNQKYAQISLSYRQKDTRVRNVTALSFRKGGERNKKKWQKFTNFAKQYVLTNNHVSYSSDIWSRSHRSFRSLCAIHQYYGRYDGLERRRVSHRAKCTRSW